VDNSTGYKEIYLSDYDGHRSIPLTSDRSIALSPRISPDGTKVLYTSYKAGQPKLYLKDLRSGLTRKLSERKGLNIGAAWTPDGSKVALTLSIKGNPDIFLIDLDGRILERLTSHWGIDVSPSFSPDGKKMAFVSNRSGSPRLTFDGNYNTSPSWSRLNRIVYTSMNHGSFDIFTIDPEGGEPRQLTENQGNNEDPCWSPDGLPFIHHDGKWPESAPYYEGKRASKCPFLGSPIIDQIGILHHYPLNYLLEIKSPAC